MRFALIAAMAVFAVALYGWGWAFRMILGPAQGRGAITLALGLASATFLGGILNAAHIAYATTLASLVLLGLILAFNAWHRRFGRWSVFRNYLGAAFASPSWSSLSIVIAIVLILGFVVATALPPAAYNTADDYGKYFFHPVRMLAYGTLYGSPLSDLGSETFGGKAFIDGFVAALFPLKYLNGTDAVFGLFLCLMLAAGFAGARGASVLALLAVFFIDPQWINISALYLGSALVMAAIALTTGAKETEKGISAAALGLVYAALVAMKMTFALFAALHLFAAAVALSLQAKSALKGLRFVLFTSIFFLLFLSPWIAVYAPHYLEALTNTVQLQGYGYGPTDYVTPLTISPLVYGSTAAQYTLVMLGALAAALAPLVLRGSGLSIAMTAATGIAGFAAYIVMFFVFGPRLSGYGEAVRYFVPICVGIVPALCGLLARHIAEAKRPLGTFARSLPWIFGALPLLFFFPSVFIRTALAVDIGVRPAFPFARTAAYAALEHAVASDAMRQKVEMLQGLVPAGEPLTVWTGAPFFLDLDRNPVSEMDSAGLATPWARLPQKGYVIWEYGGYARPLVPQGDVAHSIVVGAHERLIAGQELAFSDQIAQQAMNGTILYRDERFVVYAAAP